MHPIPATTAQQDLVNQLLAAALHTRATLEQTRRTIASTPPSQPQAAADLTDAAIALTHTLDALLDAADVLGTPRTSDRR